MRNPSGYGSVKKTYSPPVSVSEMPAHTHTRGTMEIKGSIPCITGSGKLKVDSGDGALHGANLSRYTADHEDSGYWNSSTLSINAADGWTGATSSTGSSTSHSILQSYAVVRFYRRIS